MSTHRYPIKALTGDYVRAGAGSAVTLAPMLLVAESPVMIAVLGSLAALFVCFGLRTWRRQLTRVEVTQHEITTEASAPPAPRVSIPWRGLSGLKLRFFSTQRDRKQGWLQMSLSAEDSTLRIDSNLDDFESVVRRAAAAALANDVQMDPMTTSNLDALGIVTGSDRPPAPVGAAALDDYWRRGGL